MYSENSKIIICLDLFSKQSKNIVSTYAFLILIVYFCDACVHIFCKLRSKETFCSAPFCSVPF